MRHRPAHILPFEVHDAFAFGTFVPVGITSGAGTLGWDFVAMGAATKSDTLYFTSPQSPGYVVGGLIDHSAPSPWGSLSPGSDLVPGPVPEPGAVALFGIGFLVTGLSLRRARK